MDKEMQLKFRQRLLQEREKLTGQIDFLDEQGQSGLGVSMKDSVSELSTYDNHPADLGTEVFERSKDFALRDNAMITVSAIDNALERIDSGTYGACEVCGRDIAIERLEAVPSAAKCRDCKEAEEKIPHQNDRPVEEEALGVPFARTFNEDTDSVGYDGEDAWQEVANYSESTDEWSRGGSYYGYSNFDIERKGEVEDVDNIPYEVGDDGMFYKNFRGVDDEKATPEA
ncbi:TraR/DksA C4-type zinc finger protein [Pelotomaculum propionicicum]|uniref:TraR/DksA C4-type zinc finger protein n=1 Tax=Pelotomaculum propionicicum TaxID=258475 RepID=UPI003B797F2E